jgi:hypothetical protein
MKARMPNKEEIDGIIEILIQAMKNWKKAYRGTN